MAKNDLDIDEVDREIIKTLMKNPYAKHVDIANAVDMSQPTVGLRLNKLKEKGLLQKKWGVNLNDIDGILVKIDASVIDAQRTKEEIKEVKGLVNAWRSTGESNLFVLYYGKNLREVDSFINRHLRKNGRVKFDLLSECLTDMVVPMQL